MAGKTLEQAFQKNNALSIKEVREEADFDRMCAIESAICKENAGAWQLHVGELCFDRYLYGSGAADVYNYGKLLFLGDTAIGYALAYAKESEFELRLLKAHEDRTYEALGLVCALFEECDTFATVVNSSNETLCRALLSHGFIKEDEERYQAVLDLNTWEPLTRASINRIAPLVPADYEERIRHAALPSGSEVSEEMFFTYLASPAYKFAREYVVRDASTNAFMGFITWWEDKNSQSALLEPIACLPAYRRRGVATSLIDHGLKLLKARGIRHVFVSTSIDHESAIALYERMGFVKSGEAHLYVKRKLQ